ncbi:hypothetical protein J1N35_010465 [Gossypium stocksii]|uniref:Uncharacterized protein n=1 Tax=Gossypium stocksii TaxID=47602 RepID=A0A9D3W159_9ROSI|nr:hypothetical protein J1N35_010465 [Gossypium stocksii]
MAGELIRLDNKYISVQQMKMSVDRVLQCYIRNMSGSPSPLIENCLQEAGFWHVATRGRGCNVDREVETRDAHIPSPCGECTITLEDVQLQLRLPVDGYTVTMFAQFADWGAVCYELWGAILDNINGGRIEIGWLREHSRS